MIVVDIQVHVLEWLGQAGEDRASRHGRHSQLCPAWAPRPGQRTDHRLRGEQTLLDWAWHPSHRELRPVWPEPQVHCHHRRPEAIWPYSVSGEHLLHDLSYLFKITDYVRERQEMIFLAVVKKKTKQISSITSKSSKLIKNIKKTAL